MRCIQFFSFFNFIFHSFGEYSLKLLKDWMKHKKLYYKSKLRIRFYKFCIENDIVPPHLYRLHNINVELQHENSKLRFNNLINSYIKKVLKLELSDTYRHINYAQSSLYKLERKIYRNLPVTIINAFFNRQNKGLFYYFKNEQYRMEKKMEWLLLKKKEIGSSENSTD